MKKIMIAPMTEHFLQFKQEFDAFMQQWKFEKWGALALVLITAMIVPDPENPFMYVPLVLGFLVGWFVLRLVTRVILNLFGVPEPKALLVGVFEGTKDPFYAIGKEGQIADLALGLNGNNVPVLHGIPLLEEEKRISLVELDQLTQVDTGMHQDHGYVLFVQNKAVLSSTSEQDILLLQAILTRIGQDWQEVNA